MHSDSLPPGWSLTRQGGAIVVESPTGANDGTFDYVTSYAKSPSVENRTVWRLVDMILGGNTATAPNPLAHRLDIEQTLLARERERTDKLLRLLAVVRPAVAFYTQNAVGVDSELRSSALATFDQVMASEGGRR